MVNSYMLFANLLIYFSFYILLSDHGIDLSCFSLLTDDMLKDIIPMIGHRAKFRANLEEWRKVLALANNQVSVMVRITYILLIFQFQNLNYM